MAARAEGGEKNMPVARWPLILKRGMCVIKLVHDFLVDKVNWCKVFLIIFISFLYMFRATMCASSGETTVVCDTLYLLFLYG